MPVGIVDWLGGRKEIIVPCRWWFSGMERFSFSCKLFSQYACRCKYFVLPLHLNKRWLSYYGSTYSMTYRIWIWSDKYRWAFKVKATTVGSIHNVASGGVYFGPFFFTIGGISAQYEKKGCVIYSVRRLWVLCFFVTLPKIIPKQ